MECSGIYVDRVGSWYVVAVCNKGVTMNTPRNLSKPEACTCDECGKVRSVLWLARYRLWLCPLCWEHMEWISGNRRKLIDAFKEAHIGEQSSIHP